ncbi:MAG: ABC transporter ATP-binding protein, partial [Planctomycetota bacterium]
MKGIPTLAQARQEPESRRGWYFSILWATAAGLLAPVLILVVGLMSLLLEQDGLGDTVRLGKSLSISLPTTLVQRSADIQLGLLVAVSFSLAILFCIAVWRHRRLADKRASAIVKSLHESVLRRSVRRAEVEGATAQSINAQRLIGRQLPTLQRGLSLWYRSIPRSAVMLVGCLALSLLVHIWLTVMAVISGAIVWRLYRQIRGTDRDEAGKWELPQLRSRMSAIVGRAPKMARLQAEGIAEQSFRVELDALYHKLDADDARRGRIWPILFFAISSATAVMVLGLGLTMLFEGETGLSLSSAVVIGLSLLGAVAAAWRLIELGRTLRNSGPACDSVYAYLRRSKEVTPSEQRVGFAGLRDGVEFRDVSLADSHGQAILNHITTDFNPRTLVTLLATDSVSPQAMVELLMGFGRPSNGDVRIDGLRLLDVHPAALGKNVMWIEPSGP